MHVQITEGVRKDIPEIRDGKFGVKVAMAASSVRKDIPEIRDGKFIEIGVVLSVLSGRTSLKSGTERVYHPPYLPSLVRKDIPEIRDGKNSTLSPSQVVPGPEGHP